MSRFRQRARYYPRRGLGARNAARRWFDYILAFTILGLLILVSARIDRLSTVQFGGAATVNDGDSLTLGGERIRLLGIDAPEFNQHCTRAGVDYACGRQSSQALRELIAGRAVSCSGWERDRYDRLLATCRAGDIDLNRKQVEAGWAIAYSGYEDAEKVARLNGSGLWAGSFERPRDWRAKHGDIVDGEHHLFARLLNLLRQLFRFS
jgi:endonuclease YncB( thermonuclease family)